MREKILFLLSTYTQLSTSEKELVIDIINKLITGSVSDKISLENFNESLRKSSTMNFAPVPGTCPRCGK